MADEKPAQKPSNDIVAQVVDRVRAGDNILVALSKNPGVDEMAAAIGLTLLLDKMGKHATAIFSGDVPNALEFLQPEKTFETNTNSLQDFIIALNKEKADHLRYKIEGDFVKVFITPYRTTLSEADLEFSHGDYNVDLVVALNVASAADLDAALAEHGRIMHDASSINITAGAPGKFGDLEWGDPGASSVSEMVGVLGERLKGDKGAVLDEHIATALLTGIVAATSRFSNESTTPTTMVMASKLMEAGADQQLIATNISADLMMAAVVPRPAGGADAAGVTPKRDDGASLSVRHEEAVDEPSAPVVPEETLTEAEGAEQELDKIVQAPVLPPVMGGPLMDELRQQAENSVELGGLHDNGPKKDFGALMEEELKTPEVVAAPEIVPTPIDSVETSNLATQAAPAVAGAPEINGVPTIDYGQAPEDTTGVVAPTIPVAIVDDVAAAPVVEAPVTSALPMPSEGILPPPLPPFDPSAITPEMPVAPPVAPVVPAVSVVAEQQPVAELVMPEVAPIEPAAPAPEPTHTYLGSNPAMQDQIYPEEANADPGQFQIPG